VSDGGVHSSQEHLHALIDLAEEQDVQEVAIHAITDGRDTDPLGSVGYFEKLESHIAGKRVKIASVTGRYYAMDRDKRWERVAAAYHGMVNGTGKVFDTSQKALEYWHNSGLTDEFIEPSIISNGDESFSGKVKANDVVICFNFRTDRCREITEAFTQKDFPEVEMQTMPLHWVTMTNYDETFKKVAVAFDKDNLRMTLGEVLANAGKTQVRLAETEKYPHVTFFFSGGREAPFQGESRLIAASPKVATYDLQPEMSAGKVTEKIINEIDENKPDFICLNFANPDMVGHTGVFEAIKKAVETTDNCAKQVVEKLSSENYAVIIIADHGNAELTANPDGSPHTAHTTNPVPMYVLAKDLQEVANGVLADVAPTILDLMGVAQPTEMTGKSLVVK